MLGAKPLAPLSLGHTARAKVVTAMFTANPADSSPAISTISIRPERACDAASIAKLCDTVFGPGAQTRAAAALREGVAHDIALSFVATTDSSIIGTCRLTPVLWGNRQILMLGPLGVSRSYMGTGIGKRLMAESLQAADAAGHDIVFLVGDLAYYAPFGFKCIAPDRIQLPRPADPARVLVRERVDGCSRALSGPLMRAL